jgi:hypothetical protein
MDDLRFQFTRDRRPGTRVLSDEQLEQAIEKGRPQVPLLDGSIGG